MNSKVPWPGLTIDSPMGRTLVTGATGTLGRAIRPRLRAAGHDVRGASRTRRADTEAGEWVQLDLGTGEGLESAIADVDVIVHAASDVRNAETVDVRGTERLVAAAADAGVEHIVYVSIVGIDRIPYSYYEAKLAAEEVVTGGSVPHTIVRITQFHEFIAELLGWVSYLPVWPLPTAFRSQPIAVDEAADAVVGVATTEANGRVPDVGGPSVHTGRELARAYRSARGVRRPIVRLPLPGGAARAFRAGHATCPDRDVGSVTWGEWLATEEA